MYNNNDYILDNRTKYLDPRIKECDLYDEASIKYINQYNSSCEFFVFNPDMIMFKYKYIKDVGLGVKREVLGKNVIKMAGDCCLTYFEERQFSNKKLYNLKINVEFLLTEKLEINVDRNSYAILLNATHDVATLPDYSYSRFAHIPTIPLDSFRNLPFDMIFSQCNDETVSMFEDFYSGYLYNENYVKSKKRFGK